MSNSKRCPECDVYWPPQADYNRCPKCDRLTTFYVQEPSISPEDAAAIVARKHAYAEFELYYERHAVEQFSTEIANWNAQCATLQELPTQEVQR